MPRLLQRENWRLVFACCVLSVLPFLEWSCAWSGGQGHPVEIHSVEELRELKLEDLRAQTPVRIRGYITVSDPVWNVMILEDEAGQGVRLDADDFSAPTNQLVEVTGFGVSGGNTPTIAKPVVKWLSMQKPPASRRVKLEQLFDPARQYTKVEVEGVVRGTVADRNDRIVGLMGVRNTVIQVRVIDPLGIEMNSLIDDDVRVTGVVEASYDLFGEPSRAILWVSRGDQLVRSHSARTVSELPVQSVASIIRLAPAAAPNRRLRLHGEVYTEDSGSNLVLRDGTGVIPLRLASSAALVVGKDLDAVGFAGRSNAGWQLENASVARLIEPLGQHADSSPLTTVRQLHALSPEEASRAHPIHLRGVVTYFDPAFGMLFVQDATGGTFVEGHLQKGEAPRAGQLVEVNGASEAGYFAPQVGQCSVRVVGNGEFPAPGAANSDDLYSGREDSDWVEAQGVVRSLSREAGHTILSLASGLHRFNAELLGDAPWAEGLLNSLVTVEGVAGSRFNSRKQLMGVILWVPDRRYIRLLEQAPRAEALAVTPISQLLQYSPSTNPDSAVRVRGVVTSSSPEGPTYIQDSTGAVIVASHRPVKLNPGDLVNAMGFAHFVGFSPTLQEAVLTKLGKGVPIIPVHVTADEAFDGGFDSQLIQIDAELLDRVTNQTGETLMLQTGRMLMNATVETGVRLPAFRSGAILRVTGICSIQSGTLRGFAVPRTLNIILRSADDVSLLRPEPWWTLQHAFQLTGVLAALALLASMWGLFLRRRVHQQTSVISDKLAQEESLKLAAEAASRAKSEFLAVMSHEIRTPMNGVLGMTSLLLTTPLDEDQLEFVNTIRSSGDALMTIINDILDFSKIEAGKLELEAVPFSLRLVIRESLHMVGVSAREKGLDLITSVDDRLHSNVVGDPSRFRQILLNLLSNAVKFTQQGSVTLSVVEETSDGETQTILVLLTDTGIGMSLQQQAHLFKSFSQGDSSTTRKFGGTGLGLAITKRLIEQMGGSIGLKSELGAGSTFWFRLALPIQKRAGQPIPSDEPEQLPVSA